MIDFNDLLGAAITLAKELSAMTAGTVPAQLLTESKSLFGVISKRSRTLEKRLLLDNGAAREGVKDKVISDIGFVRSTQNVADKLTKSMSQGLLGGVVSRGFHYFKLEQRIVRS